jgi:phosphatidylserine/phosphatidylglycerophosphate/cardiolipin synthase-like enzyme
VAHRRGVDISIITDDDKSFDLGSDINRLDRMGLDVITDRSPVHMHHKFALFDEDTVLTGSYNWTRSAADHNYENIIVLKDPIVFAAYEREFKRLWKQLR